MRKEKDRRRKYEYDYEEYDDEDDEDDFTLGMEICMYISDTYLNILFV